jgi:hypothetical protein
MIIIGRRRYKQYIYNEKRSDMGLLTPKNNKGDKKSKNKQNAQAQGSKFLKQNSKASGANKKPIKTGGARGS